MELRISYGRGFRSDGKPCKLVVDDVTLIDNDVATTTVTAARDASIIKAVVAELNEK